MLDLHFTVLIGSDVNPDRNSQRGRLTKYVLETYLVASELDP